MPVDIKSILEAAEPKPVIDPQFLSLARLAQANRTYNQAQDLRQEQEYNTLAIAQGQEIAGSVNVMDSIADIDIAIDEISKLSQANRDNKLVQASYTKLQGGLENTRELSEGRTKAVESLSTLRGDTYKMFENLSKGGLYNESNVLDLINNTRNFVNTKAHFMDEPLREDIEAEIDRLSKTVNLYNMFQFYDTDLATPGLDFETKPESAKFLSGMQQGLLQQAKNYLDTGLVDEAAKTIAQLPAVGLAESKITAASERRDQLISQDADYRSQIEDINQETNAWRGFMGHGVESGAEMDLPKDFKKKVGSFLVDLPSDPGSLVGPGGLGTVNTAIEQASEALEAVLGETYGGLFDMETLDDIIITPNEAAYLNINEGASLDDVFKAYQKTAVTSEKEPYMDILAKYTSDPEVGERIATGFTTGDIFGISDEENNAVRIMIGVANTYTKLKTLRQVHFIDFPISEAYNQLFQSQGYNQQSTGINW